MLMNNVHLYFAQTSAIFVGDGEQDPKQAARESCIETNSRNSSAWPRRRAGRSSPPLSNFVIPKKKRVCVQVSTSIYIYMYMAVHLYISVYVLKFTQGGSIWS